MSQLYDTAATIRSERLAAAEHYRLIRSVQRPTLSSFLRRLWAGQQTHKPWSHRPSQAAASVAA